MPAQDSRCISSGCCFHQLTSVLVCQVVPGLRKYQGWLESLDLPPMAAPCLCWLVANASRLFRPSGLLYLAALVRLCLLGCPQPTGDKVKMRQCGWCWAHLPLWTVQIFVEFLERSCTAEFSGFLLYKELGRRLKKTNPVVAEVILPPLARHLAPRSLGSLCAKRPCLRSAVSGMASAHSREVARVPPAGRRGGRRGALSSVQGPSVTEISSALVICSLPKSSQCCDLDITFAAAVINTVPSWQSASFRVRSASAVGSVR